MTFNLPFAKNKTEKGNISRRDIFNAFLSAFLAIPSPLSSNVERYVLPNTDIYETDSEYCLGVELPGMTSNNIDLKIDNNILTIKGQKEEFSENKEKSYHIRERYYGSFQRTISLPNNISDENIQAQFENGILSIRIPKEQGKTKKIEVKSQ